MVGEFGLQGYGLSNKSSFSGSAVGSELLASCGGSKTRMTVTSAPKNRAAVKSSKSDESETVRVGVLGASGYTGSEVLWLSLELRFEVGVYWSDLCLKLYCAL